jgi:quercetin dioxygenase-like cupin family protein
MSGIIPAAQALRLADLITPTERGVASRTLANASGGNVTLFAFDAGEGLSEHRTPFDALILVVDGALSVTIGGHTVEAESGTIVRLPADIPHAVEAPVASRMAVGDAPRTPSVTARSPWHPRHLTDFRRSALRCRRAQGQ